MKKMRLLSVAMAASAFLAGCGGSGTGDQAPRVAFDKIVLGELGGNMTEFRQAMELFDFMFDFAPARERAKMQGLNAQKLFAFS